MANSIEARSPFLDHHLMEFAALVPPEGKLDRTIGKRPLKSTLDRVLPSEILKVRRLDLWFDSR